LTTDNAEQGPGKPRPGRSRAGRAAGLMVAVTLVVLGLTGCTNNTFTRLGFPPPITRQGNLVLTLWQGSWIAGLAVGVLVWGLILWAVIFHRKRGDKLPPQARYNMPIEIMYTAVPFVLIAVSFVKPVYYVRYIEFCLPALAILAGAGLTGLIRLAVVTPLRRSRAGRWRLGPLRLAWLPAVLAVAVLAALLAGPQQAIRQTAARPDNLRLASAIVAAHEQPGDVVFYIPATMHVIGTGYPAPFGRLRDIALNDSATASGTLTGTEITKPARLKSRFTASSAQRVWVVTGASTDKFPVPSTPADKEKMALLAGAGLHILHRWQAGEVMLTLYGP